MCLTLLEKKTMNKIKLIIYHNKSTLKKKHLRKRLQYHKQNKFIKVTKNLTSLKLANMDLRK